MPWDKRTVEVSVLFIWVMTLMVLIIVTTAFELGIFIGRKQTGIAQFKMMQQRNSQRRVGVEVPTERAPIITTPMAKPFAAEKKETQYEVFTDELAEETDTGKKTQYTIQVGAFGSLQNAEGMVNLLQVDGYTCWIDTEPPSGMAEAMNVVFVGKFETKQAAERFGGMLLDRLADLFEYTIKEIQE